MDSGTEADRLLVLRLRALLEVLPAALDRQVSAFGITSYEYALLQTVLDSEHGRLRLVRLARSTNATLPRLSRVMTSLERRGFVQRVRSEDDARATEAVLTPAGQAVVEAARPAMDRAVKLLVLDPLVGNQRECTSAAIHSILRALDPDGRLAITAPALRNRSSGAEREAGPEPEHPAETSL